MRLRHWVAAALLSSMLASCADHNGAIPVPDSAPPPPIGGTDPGVVNEPGSGTTGNSNNEPGSGNGGGNNGGGTGGTGGNNPPSGGGGQGQPVPEPATMFLVGTGLVGAGATLLRRRRKKENS